eukprot:CAMPEP_0172767394 /NCGR_PEP_ID=MMETSP1074-20121228/182867_1 /TAXON_ID=2916 /ORGANISM="Ceratium fusus, Strain PA161109" /LENGTH=37 /DNA_ID= /DNA_START= /DNA_END= /DNA_ORIENTATION=
MASHQEKGAWGPMVVSPSKRRLAQAPAANPAIVCTAM